jgi:hypothetical protein
LYGPPVGVPLLIARHTAASGRQSRSKNAANSLMGRDNEEHARRIRLRQADIVMALDHECEAQRARLCGDPTLVGALELVLLSFGWLV